MSNKCCVHNRLMSSLVDIIYTEVADSNFKNVNMILGPMPKMFLSNFIRLTKIINQDLSRTQVRQNINHKGLDLR